MRTPRITAVIKHHTSLVRAIAGDAAADRTG
jgi:hypothetical protein